MDEDGGRDEKSKAKKERSKAWAGQVMQSMQSMQSGRGRAEITGSPRLIKHQQQESMFLYFVFYILYSNHYIFLYPVYFLKMQLCMEFFVYLCVYWEDTRVMRLGHVMS